MDFEHIKTRYAALKEELELFAEMGTTPVKRLSGALNTASIALDDLRKALAESPFSEAQQEINFFKYEKPLFAAEKLYALEIFNIESNRPPGDEILIRQFYEDELKFIKRFFTQYRFLYQYYQLDAHELDHLLFIRGASTTVLVLPDTNGFDPAFATSGDHIFAQFIAYERIQEYLIKLIYSPIDNTLPYLITQKDKPLKWTGSKSDLIELAYGIYGTMQINGGEADIADIIAWLEQTLNISLGRYYQAFSEIKARKSISKTRYLDHMKEMLTKHIDEGDAFKPRNRSEK